MADEQSGIQPERIQDLNDKPLQGGDYVLYWMQQAQRAEYNHALEHAARRASALGKPLLVAFGLTDDYPEANLRHYHFMLEGLQDVEQALTRRGVRFVVRRGAPDEVALNLAQNAALLVCDRGYLRPQRVWRERVAEAAPCRVVQVESDVVVPVELASPKKEHAARTLRPRLTRHLPRFLVELPETKLERGSLGLDVRGEDLSDIGALLERLKLEQQVLPVRLFRGGTTEAKGILHGFLEKNFAAYARTRNQPQTNFVSHMSKYLHFGEVSPLYVALQVRAAGASPDNTESYSPSQKE